MSMNRRDFLTNSAKVAAVGALVGAGLVDSQVESAQAASSIVAHGSRTKPQVALTFHGAGDVGIAKSLLDIFKSTSTPVTVFGIGIWLQANPTMAKTILDGGHDLGNHTMHHYEMRTLSAKKVDSEILQCSNVLKKMIGNHGSWFRASGIQYATPLIQKSALKYGYPQCISYDVDSTDYLDPGKSAIVKRTMAGIKNGSIVSLHFGHAGTVQALPTLLEQLHAKGLTPVTLTTMLGKI